MLWTISHRADPDTASLADRHYSRQKIGSKQFVPPGRCVVLLSKDRRAYWVTSWPFAEYVKHRWAGAWICSAFRNEGDFKSSDLIRDALSATMDVFGTPPPLGMVTFVNRKHVKPTKVRGRNVYGFCFTKAGFIEAGETKGGLVALQLPPDRFPTSSPALFRLTREW